jgi:hypothetical protein
MATVISRTAKPLLALTATAVLGALAAGCGSQTKTESVAETPPAATTATGTQASTPTRPSTTTTASPPAGGTSAPSTTRTAPEPAFAQGQSNGQGSSEAVSVVHAHGYSAGEPSQYHPDQTLRVLVGTRSGSSDGYGQQAFFFVDGRYIGTDTKEPSATVKLVSQSDTEVTLAYPLYRPGDPLANPSGGQAVVHFQLNNGKLTPLGTIPPASSSSGLARN